MTYAALKTYLTNALPTSGIVQLQMGWLWELNLNRDGAAEYPLIFVEIPNKSIKTRTKCAENVNVKVDFYFLKYWDRNTSTDDDIVVYDAINTLAEAYFAKLNTSSYIGLINPDNIPSEPIPDGIVTDFCVGVKYSVDLKLAC